MEKNKMDDNNAITFSEMNANVDMDKNVIWKVNTQHILKLIWFRYR
jgi:hypothetical protein